MYSMYAHMPLLEMPSATKFYANDRRNKILGKLGLKEGGTELRILTALSDISSTNVYKLWKQLQNIGHYSTVFRALKRLESKRLVMVQQRERTGRNKNVYSLTQLGDLILALSQDGWKTTARLLTKKSLKFSQCIEVRRSLHPFYYYPLARNIIEKMLSFPRYRNTQPDLEKIVVECESQWIREKVAEEMGDPSARPELFRYLMKLSYADWIRPIVLSLVDEYIREEKEWLQALGKFSKELYTDRKITKLTQFFGRKDASTNGLMKKTHLRTRAHDRRKT